MPKRKTTYYPFLTCSLLLLIFGITTIHSTEVTDVIEICDNAIDDDMDGEIDLNDADCSCELIEPVSLIPNPSFESITCCPTGRSQLRCAADWIQASEPTTDLIHSCDWLGWEEFPPPLPFPDGDGILGFRDGRVRELDVIPERNWKEYAGACLLAPLNANTTYRFEFHLGFVDQTRSPPIDITFFGTTDCANLPFGERDEAFGCPTNGPNWMELGATNINGGNGNNWVKSYIEVTPTEAIHAIVIGPSCDPVDAPMSIYYFFDNLVLSDSKSFEAQIVGIEHPCSENFSLQVGEDPSLAYQWYKEGISLIGETSHQLMTMYGEGNYQVRTTTVDGNCRVSTTYNHLIPRFSESISEVICPQTRYPFAERELSESGTYVHTFQTEENCDNEVSLDLTVLDQTIDTVETLIFEGQAYDFNDNQFFSRGEHVIKLTSDLGCDSLVLLVIDYHQIYIPNVFSPNNDDTNDLFTVYSNDGLIDNIELAIYTRWGERVHTGSHWDGTKNGELVLPGTYIYSAQVSMLDGNEQVFSGEITVIN